MNGFLTYRISEVAVAFHLGFRNGLSPRLGNVGALGRGCSDAVTQRSLVTAGCVPRSILTVACGSHLFLSGTGAAVLCAYAAHAHACKLRVTQADAYPGGQG